MMTTNDNPRWLPERGPLTAKEKQELNAFFQMLGVTPHPGQLNFMAERGKYKVLLCGRRWGKSRTIAMEVLLHILECIQLGFDHGRIMMTAMNYKQITQESLEYLRQMLKKIDLPLVRRTSREGQFWQAGPVRLEIRSLANRKGLRGAGLTMLVVDECSLVPEEVFFYDLFPSVTDYKGRVLIAGTPAGINWVVKFVEQQGLEIPYSDLNRIELIKTADHQVVMMRSPTWANPFIDPSEIERQRQLMPDAAFRQEYGAEILLDGGIAFPDKPIVIDKPPPDLLVNNAVWAVGLDYGYNEPSAIVLLAKLPNGIYYVARTIYERMLTVEDFADLVAQSIPKGVHARIAADPSFWNRDGRHQVADALSQRGITARPGTWDRVGRWNMLRNLLAAKTVYILDSGNADLLYEIENAKPKLNKPDDINKPDHALSALTYALEMLEHEEATLKPPDGTYGEMLIRMREERLRLMERAKRGRITPTRRW
ncbi:MAG: terminase [Patescibacteria group bacterium]|nr:MAG: terminase [Patescibacteria group bacterium]